MIRYANTELGSAVVLDDLRPKPKWDLIQPAKPVYINNPKEPRKARTRHKVWSVLPDPQIGYRHIDGQWLPFHDEAAMDVALQITNWLYHNDRVDGVINLGDFLDLPSQGRFEQEAAFAGTTPRGRWYCWCYPYWCVCCSILGWHRSLRLCGQQGSRL